MSCFCTCTDKLFLSYSKEWFQTSWKTCFKNKIRLSGFWMLDSVWQCLTVIMILKLYDRWLQQIVFDLLTWLNVENHPSSDESVQKKRFTSFKLEIWQERGKLDHWQEVGGVSSCVDPRSFPENQQNHPDLHPTPAYTSWFRRWSLSISQILDLKALFQNSNPSCLWNTQIRRFLLFHTQRFLLLYRNLFKTNHLWEFVLWTTNLEKCVNSTWKVLLMESRTDISMSGLRELTKQALTIW